MDSQPSTSQAAPNKYFNFHSGELVDFPTDTNLQVNADDNTSEICDVCKSSTKDHITYGHFFLTKFAKCHYFCLLLTVCMTQSLKNDKAGILGFGRADILNARAVIAANVCHYCGTKNANLQCAVQSCRRQYHLVCGHTNNCQYDFADYVSFCNEHVTIRCPEDWPIEEIEASECCLCFEEIGSYNTINHLLLNCCENGWLHRRCLQKYADSAGYNLQCPICVDGDNTAFRNAVRKLGIFVWDRDASWEFEGRYDDIDKLKCTLKSCQLRGSKKYLTCIACGHKMGHALCLGVAQEQIDSYTCDECFDQSFMAIILPLNS